MDAYDDKPLDKAEVKAQIRRARVLLERDGWIQGTSIMFSYHNPMSPEVVGRCASGALQEARNDAGRIDPRIEDYARARIEDAASNGQYATWRGIVPWNDTTGRTKAEVIDAFVRAEALCDE